MKAVEQFFRFRASLAFQRFRHQRRRCDRNRASRATEPSVFDGIAFELKFERKPVSAQRIESLRVRRGRFEMPEISRLLRMIENDFLIQIVDQSKISLTFSKPRIRASTSSRVL